MQKSESIGALAAALAKAQGEIMGAPMQSKNPFLGNSYADLGSVISTAKPILAKNELSVSQLVIGGDDVVGIETILMHSSGEFLSSIIALPVGEEKGKSRAQVAGSIITYLRRYSYAAILGMYADEDIDGNGASGQATDSGREQRGGANKASQSANNQSAGAASPSQIKAIYAIATKELNLTDKALEGAVQAKYGRIPAELTKSEASGLIDAMKAGKFVAGAPDAQSQSHASKSPSDQANSTGAKPATPEQHLAILNLHRKLGNDELRARELCMGLHGHALEQLTHQEASAYITTLNNAITNAAKN